MPAQQLRAHPRCAPEVRGRHAGLQQQVVLEKRAEGGAGQPPLRHAHGLVRVAVADGAGTVADVRVRAPVQPERAGAQGRGALRPRTARDPQAGQEAGRRGRG